MPNLEGHVSFADYARAQTGDHRADIELPPAHDYLEELIQAFWRGDFEGANFKNHAQNTAIKFLGNPDGTWIGDDGKFLDEREGFEIHEPINFDPVTRQTARQILCLFGFLPDSMSPFVRDNGDLPPFSEFANTPLERYLEDGNKSAKAGFEYLSKLLVHQDDLKIWRDSAQTKQEAHQPQRTMSRQELDALLRNRIDKVRAKARRIQRGRKPISLSERDIADLLTAHGTQKFEGFSRETIRKILRGKYGPMHRLGISGERPPTNARESPNSKSRN